MEKKRILFFLYLIFCSSLFAQQHLIDSLNAVIKIENNDTIKVKAINLLAYNLIITGDYARADSLTRKALQLAEPLNYYRGIANCYDNIGGVYSQKGDFYNAMKYYDLEIDIDRKIGSKRGEASALNNIGLVYYNQARFPQALEYYLKSLKLSEEVHDNLIDISYGNIANVYCALDEDSSAMVYYNKALEMETRQADKGSMAWTLNAIATIYEDWHNYSKAIVTEQKAIRLAEEAGDKSTKLTAIGSMGDVYSREGNYDSALIYELQFYNGEKELGLQQGISAGLAAVAEVYLHQGRYKEALDYSMQSLQIGKQIGVLDEVATAQQILSEVYDAKGDWVNALAYYRSYIAAHDSLSNEENTKKIVQEQMQYDFDKKQAEEKAQQEKKDALTIADKRKQQYITASVSVGLLLVLLFSGLLFSRFRITRKQKKIIEEQKGIVEEKNKDILDSITYAKRLQDAILPPLSEIEKQLPESFVLYKPKDIVAGDFYWMEKVEDTILIAACDCTGHGVPGAMVSVVCSNALNRAVKEFHLTAPGKILDKTKELLLETFEKSEGDVKDGMDCSFAAINTKTGVIEWSGAYNPLWYMNKGELKEINGDKQPIGKHDTSKPFSTHKLQLAKGDSLYLFTDGYADQFGGPKGKKFKYQQLQQLITGNAQLPMKEQKEILKKQLAGWQGNLEQVDDILIIGIRV